MPSLIERFNNLPNSDRRYASFTSEGVVNELRRFHYDTAIITHPAPLAALTTLVPMSQIVFGSDYPFRRATTTVAGGPAAASRVKRPQRANRRRGVSGRNPRRGKSGGVLLVGVLPPDRHGNAVTGY